jgi:Arc/MetJ-type ribon-helix-helix transcriptional regulator
MSFHNRRVSFRIKQDLWQKVIDEVERHPDKYDSTGHFVRSAIIQLLRREK